MKKVTFLLAFVLATASVFAQTWTSDKAHSKLGFTVTHMGISDVDGAFKDFEAKITASKEDFSDAVIELSAKTASIDTDFEMRDNHLKQADMFDAEKHPTLTFKSTSVQKVADKKFKVTGDLTLKGVTKTVTLDLTLGGVATNPRSQKKVAGFKATGTIKRTDFGVGNMPAMMVSEEVELRASGEFNEG